MTKKIKIATLLIALLGLCNELKFLYFDVWNDQVNYFIMILDFLSSINLEFANVNFFLTENGFVYNYPNITFYILLLLSVALYHFSKQKEIRLLRFLLSLQFLSNVISFLIVITLYLIYRDEYGNSYPVYILIFSLLTKAGFIALFYYFLRYFKENVTLDFTIKTTGNESQNLVVITRKMQRFFHLIMDSFCIFLLFSFIIKFSDLWQAPIFKEEYMLYVLLFIIRTIYYTFFEGLLNATPAKLLTGSRVIDEKGKSPKFQNIFTRTLSRFIPFEAISFLGEKGWHDKISNTYVVKEKRGGVKANTYLLIIPIISIIFLSIYYGREAYQDYLYEKADIQRFDSNKKQIKNQIKQLSSNTIIQIEPINYSDEYANSELYLKVEHITNNKITASLLIMEKESLLKVEEFYDAFKSRARKITFDKSELENTYFTSYETYKQTNVTGANLLKDGSNYELKQIRNLYDPKLELGSSMNIEDNKIIISLKNNGWKAEFIEFKNNSGSTKWEIEQIENNYSETEYLNYNLVGSPFNANENVDLIIKTKNEYNKMHSYKLTGEYGNLHLEKVE
jgi:uncharacterized RDD family membrane protein YckC